KALLRVDGGPGSDTLNVDDSGDTTADVMILTGHSLMGLDMTTIPSRLVTLTNVTGGSFTLTLNGLTTVPLPYLVDANTVKAALQSLSVSHISAILVNRNVDTFSVGFIGDELMGTPALAVNSSLTGDAGAGTPSAVVTPWATDLVQNIAVAAAAGTYLVHVGTGALQFSFTVGDSAASIKSSLFGLIGVANALDILVDQIGSTYIVTYQGTLAGLTGQSYRFSVAPNSILSQGGGAADLTVNAV